MNRIRDLSRSWSRLIFLPAGLVGGYAKASYDSIIAQIAEEHKRVQRMQAFIRNVRELGVITEFDETLWELLVDKVVVYSKDDIRVEFINSAIKYR